MTVYGWANKYFKDEEFNRGGIPSFERKCFDDLGFEYKVNGGCIAEAGEDATKFIEALCSLYELHKKYDC